MVRDLLYQIFRSFLTVLNKVLPKSEKAVVQGFPNNEGSAIEVYNYLTKHKKIEVYYIIDERLNNHPGRLLHQPKILEKSSLLFFYHYLTSKYIFFTHGSTLNSFSKGQVVVNVWHGLCFKPVGILIGNKGIKADLTVSTSEFTKPMFMKSFGVPYEKVIGSGYPRNDILIREKPNAALYRQKLHLGHFEKVIIWLPTYRKAVIGEVRNDGMEAGNPFYIQNFNLPQFNNILKSHNSVCFVKPHPMAPRYESQEEQSNVVFINDQWLSHHDLTLYHLAGFSDILISDVSSIIADYLLMDKPIICVNEDFEDYKKSRGFYFDDIENWIPSPICKSEAEFLAYLKMVLESGNDPFEDKRIRIRDLFFDSKEGNSAERVVEEAFSIIK